MYLFLVSLFGLAWGSFVLTLADRLEKPKSILVGRSRCPHCGKRLMAYDLVPVLSFVMLAGRCRWCKKPIGLIYPAVELVFAGVFYLIFWRFGLHWVQIPLVLSVSLLAVGALRDIKEKEVDLAIFLFGIPLALIWFFLQNGLSLTAAKSLLLAVIVAALLPGAFAVLSKQKWMGYGDILFALWAGVIAGYPGAIVALFVAFLCGSLFGIIQIVMGKAKMKTAVSFGPFLALGSMVGLFLGQNLFNLYLKLFGL